MTQNENLKNVSVWDDILLDAGQTSSENRNGKTDTGKDFPKKEKKTGEVTEKVSKAVILKKKPVCILFISVMLMMVILYLYGNNIKEERYREEYEKATREYEQGDYESAYKLYAGISSYKDAVEMAKTCADKVYEGVYIKATELRETGAYENARREFLSIVPYKDSADRAEECEKALRERYVDYIGVEVFKINKYKELSMAICDINISKWNTYKDFNVIGMKVREEYAESIRQMRIGAAGLKEQVEEIEILEGSEMVIALLNDLYDIYVKIHEGAINPLGDSNTYRIEMNTFSNRFDALLKEMFIQEPGLKVSFDRATGLA